MGPILRQTHLHSPTSAGSASGDLFTSSQGNAPLESKSMSQAAMQIHAVGAQKPVTGCPG
jgi:hypothetical protein